MGIYASNVELMIDDDALSLVRAHSSDAGLDLRSPVDAVVPAHGSVCIDTGIHMALPFGTFGKLESKSGLHVKHDIVCLGGVIDSSYRGSIVVKLYNMGNSSYEIKRGDKIVQLIIQPCMLPDLVLVSELDETERGENGFGSSGR